MSIWTYCVEWGLVSIIGRQAAACRVVGCLVSVVTLRSRLVSIEELRVELVTWSTALLTSALLRLPVFVRRSSVVFVGLSPIYEIRTPVTVLLSTNWVTVAMRTLLCKADFGSVPFVRHKGVPRRMNGSLMNLANLLACRRTLCNACRRWT